MNEQWTIRECGDCGEEYSPFEAEGGGCHDPYFCKAQ